MTKFPLLEQMRAERQRREDAVTEPFRFELITASRMVDSLRERLRAIEKIVGSEIGKYAIENIARQVSTEVRRLIWEAVAKAGGARRKPVTITFDPESLAFMDMRSVEQEVLRRYVDETLPRLSFEAFPRPDECVTILDIRVPQLGVRQHVARI